MIRPPVSVEISFEWTGDRFIDNRENAHSADQKSVHDKLGIQGFLAKIEKMYGFSPNNLVFRIVFSRIQGVGPLPVAARGFGPVPE